MPNWLKPITVQIDVFETADQSYAPITVPTDVPIQTVFRTLRVAFDYKLTRSSASDITRVDIYGTSNDTHSILSNYVDRSTVSLIIDDQTIFTEPLVSVRRLGGRGIFGSTLLLANTSSVFIELTDARGPILEVVCDALETSGHRCTFYRIVPRLPDGSEDYEASGEAIGLYFSGMFLELLAQYGYSDPDIWFDQTGIVVAFPPPANFDYEQGLQYNLNLDPRASAGFMTSDTEYVLGESGPIIDPIELPPIIGEPTQGKHAETIVKTLIYPQVSLTHRVRAFGTEYQIIAVQHEGDSHNSPYTTKWTLSHPPIDKPALEALLRQRSIDDAREVARIIRQQARNAQ